MLIKWIDLHATQNTSAFIKINDGLMSFTWNILCLITKMLSIVSRWELNDDHNHNYDDDEEEVEKKKKRKE